MRWVLYAVIVVASAGGAARGQTLSGAKASWWIPAAPDTELTWPAVAAVRGGYIAACVRLVRNGADLVVISVDDAGIVRSAPRVVAHASDRSGIGAPALAGDGRECILVWEEAVGAASMIRLLRVGRDGTPVETPLSVADGIARTRPLLPRVTARNGEALVVWTDWLTDPPVARAVWLTRSGDTRSFAIRASGEPVSGPDASWDGGAVVLAWIQGDVPSRVMTARVQERGTVPGDAHELSDESVQVRRTWVRLSGGADAATWCEADGPRLVVRARSLSRPGDVLSPGIESDGHEIAPSCVAGPAGVLCAWERGGLAGPRVYARWLERRSRGEGDAILLSSSDAHSPAVTSSGRTTACVWLERDRREWPTFFGLRAVVAGRSESATSERPPGTAPSVLSIRRRGTDMTLEIHAPVNPGDRVGLFRVDGRRVGREVIVDRSTTGAGIDIVRDLDAPARIPLIAVLRTRTGILTCPVPALRDASRRGEIGYFRR